MLRYSIFLVLVVLYVKHLEARLIIPPKNDFRNDKMQAYHRSAVPKVAPQNMDKNAAKFYNTLEKVKERVALLKQMVPPAQKKMRSSDVSRYLRGCITTPLSPVCSYQSYDSIKQAVVSSTIEEVEQLVEHCESYMAG